MNDKCARVILNNVVNTEKRKDKTIIRNHHATLLRFLWKEGEGIHQGLETNCNESRLGSQPLPSGLLSDVVAYSCWKVLLDELLVGCL